MTNTSVCLLLVALFGCAHLSYARQTPRECTKGPSYWCQNLKQAAECGAVGHCIADVWEKQEVEFAKNDISAKFVRLFQELKDIKDLINDEYLAIRVNSACDDVQDTAVASVCRENTAHLETYLHHVLASNATAETMCRLVGMCDDAHVDTAPAPAVRRKKPTPDQRPTVQNNRGEQLLGSQQCTWGPAYWCSNISTSHQCKAVHHCVQRVWSAREVPEDTDSICKICTDMVKQARDQLQSNETQEDLKAVFEGSCKLIPIKIVAQECMKLADDFVPELVETLSSQMNPQAVCSVAGLCNSERIDNMLEEYNAQLSLRADCYNCNRTVSVLRKKFDATGYEDFLVGLLRACGDMGSFSDSCSMLVFKHYESILAALRQDLTPGSVCHVSGQCAYQFHSHDEFTFPDAADVSATDDVPCEFCEQLITHLRDTLIANTTEIEFHKILDGLCKQTGQFKTECLSLVDQHYSEIYNFLVKELNGRELCTMIGICGRREETPVAPLLPRELAVKVINTSPLLIGTDEANSYNTDAARVPLAGQQTNVRVLGPDTASAPAPAPAPAPGPLPIERMFVSVPQSTTSCSFCQYLLHYLQVEISDSRNEEMITEAVQKACDKLPSSVEAECKQFITEYGPAVIALLVQEIDPSSVCPALGLCPQTHAVRRVDVNAESSSCPLCLFAVEQLETMLANNRSETSIRQALEKLCSHLSQKLRTECTDFVETYSKQLIEMLLADLNSQEICVYLKLCKDEVADPLAIARPAGGEVADPTTVAQPSTTVDTYHEQPALRADRNNRRRPMLPREMLEPGFGGDIETNEIPDNTANGRPVAPALSRGSACVMCEFVMTEIDAQIKDKHNEDEIKRIVLGVCSRMPKTVKGECDRFVEQYADFVIRQLVQNLDPKLVCTKLRLCPAPAAAVDGLNAAREEVLDCAVCETVVLAVKKVLRNDRLDRNIVHIVERSCGMLPAKYNQRCHTMMEIYGDSVIHLIEEFGTKEVCQKIGMCSASSGAYVHMHYARRTRD